VVTKKKAKPKAKTLKKTRKAAKKKPVAKKKRSATKSSSRSKSRKTTTSRRRPAAKAKKISRRKTSVGRKTVKRKTASRKLPRGRVKAARSRNPGSLAKSPLTYKKIEAEILKLTHLLQNSKKRNQLIRKSLAYLEKEQKKLTHQIQEAKKFLTRIKNRGIQALREFPDNAEDIYYQLKSEFNRISKILGFG